MVSRRYMALNAISAVTFWSPDSIQTNNNCIRTESPRQQHVLAKLTVMALKGLCDASSVAQISIINKSTRCYMPI